MSPRHATDQNPHGPVGMGDGPPARFVDVPAYPARCKCSHAKPVHGKDRNDRPVCFGGSVCGCREFRPSESIPARFDERYDPSPEPIDRSIQ